MNVKQLKSEYEKSNGALLLGDDATAAILGIDVRLLKEMRYRGRGPSPERVFANTAWYRKTEIERFRNERTTHTG